MSEDSHFGVVLWTTDIPALSDFLVGVAEMDLEERMPGFASLRVDGGQVLLHSADEAYRGHPWHEALAREGVARGIGAELRVRVSSVERGYARALQMGALAIEAPTPVDGTLECQVMGPDGFLLTLWEPFHI